MIAHLEDFLSYGSVHIAPANGFLFKAAFNRPTKGIVKVQSDRGLPHLLELLTAAIVDDEKLRQNADERYPCSLGIASDCCIERSLRRVYVEIYKFEEQIYVRLQRVNDDINGMPGLSSRQANGSTIEEALTKAIKSKPVRITGFSTS